MKTIAFDCPYCCVRLIHSIPVSSNSEDAIFYSDGFAIGPHLPRVSNVVQCPVCDEVFFYDALEIQLRLNEKESSTKAVEPSMEHYIELLKNSKELSLDQQIYLRKELWYYGTHHPVGSDALLNNPDFKMQWIENLENLESILDAENQEQVLIKAEANRHLGRFARCLELLESNELSRCDIKFIKTLRKKAHKGNTEVFET
jgi:hypothetical protein